MAALTRKQEQEIGARVRAGADLPALVAFAKAKDWTVSRAKLGQLLKANRDMMAEVAAAMPKPAAPEELAAKVEDLVAQVASLRGRLDGMLTLPRTKLSDVMNAAVFSIQQQISDPSVDHAARVKYMAQLPELAKAAREALEAENTSGDDELGI